jgi:hypothetical protein
MADDALSRARKALAAPKSGAVVPAERSGRDLIEQAKAASQRPLPTAPVVRAAPNDESKGSALIARVKEAAPRPVSAPPKIEAQAAPSAETKAAASTALVERAREAAARPIPIRPVVKAPEPPPVVEPSVTVPVEAPTAVPATVPTAQNIPIEVGPGQTVVPVEVPQNAAGGTQQPITIVLNVENNHQQHGPYGWPYYWPYWRPYVGCGRRNCPNLVGQVCHRWSCW